MTTDPPPDPTSDAALNDAAIAVALSGRPYEIADLWELPGNPHDGDDRAVADSLARFGQVKPIAVSADGCVIAGNTTFRAARDILGWSRIAGVEMTHEEAEAKAYALADNRTAQLGRDDPERMVAFFGEIEEWSGIGWDEEARAEIALMAEQDAVLPEPTRPPEPDVPLPLPADPVTPVGGVWTLGPHRLVCGDSRDADVYAALLDGDGRVDMVWTDPPYGVKVASRIGTKGVSSSAALEAGGDTIANDDLDAAGLDALLTDAFGRALAASRPGAVWFVASPAGPMFGVFANVLTRYGIWRQTLVWLKDSLVLSRSDYHYRHEALFMGWVPGAGHHRPETRDGDSVWECPRPRRSEEHPTMKPVALIARAVATHTNHGDLVLDPFSGSGSTLIACDQLDRVARCVELDQGYCDVIARRYQLATGNVPLLNGEPIDFEPVAA